MDITVRTPRADVPDRVRDDVVTRLEHATRFYDRLLDVEVAFREESNPRITNPARVELTGRTKGHQIRAEGQGEDFDGAVDIAISRFERQLRRYKTRLVDRTRHRAPIAEVTANNGFVPSGSQPAPDEASDDAPEIVRSKSHEMVPMLPEDAALHLELLGHDFYLFTNAATGRCNVIYERRDGNLGLIEGVGPGDADD